jgi:ribosome maturation factor RimP
MYTFLPSDFSKSAFFFNGRSAIDGLKVFEGKLAEFDGQTVTIEMTVKTRKKRVNFEVGFFL